MYGFVLNMYVMRKIDADKVQSYVDKYITQEQADTIVATPLN